MRFTSVLAINAGVALGFFAARQLLSNDAPAQIAKLPEAARGPLLATRARLLRGQARFAVAWNEAIAERDQAAIELADEYRRYTAFPRQGGHE